MNLNAIYLLRLSFWFASISVISYTGYSQEINISQVTTDTSSVSRHSLYAGAGYGSNMVYLGSTISKNNPYSYAGLSYGYNDEFFASFSGVHLSGIKSFMTFYSGALTYNHDFNSWLDVSAGISGYKFAQNITDTLPDNFIYGDVTLGVDWRLIYSKISFGRVFSSENTNYLQIKNSRFFQTPGFFHDKLNFSFDPYVNLIFGTMVRTETSYGLSFTSVAAFRKWRAGRLNIPYTARTVYSDYFGLMELDLGLPISLNAKRFTIEAEPGYVLPYYDDNGSISTKGFIFLISAFIRIL